MKIVVCSSCGEKFIWPLKKPFTCGFCEGKSFTNITKAYGVSQKPVERLSHTARLLENK